MYWDSPGLTFILSVISLAVLLILLKLKVIKEKQIPFILMGNILFFWYFNRVFTGIPLADHTPLLSFEKMAERGLSEWTFLHYSDLNSILSDPELFERYMHEEWLPTLSMIGASFFYTLGLKWHRKIKWALAACLVSISVFVLFPLIENRIWGGLVYYVEMSPRYLCIVFYIVGYLLCRLFLYFVKRFRQIKAAEYEAELNAESEVQGESEHESEA